MDEISGFMIQSLVIELLGVLHYCGLLKLKLVGKPANNYGKIPCLMGKLSMCVAILNGYI